MDPDCAICGAPAEAACECEAKGLDVAIKQAEDKIMKAMYIQIRSWVRAHAQDYILEYFRTLSDQRKDAHSNQLDHITARAWNIYNAPPHPQQLADAQEGLKAGIDADWKASVSRYPEVLEYFFNLVELSLPPDDDPAVVDPSLPAPQRKPVPRGAQTPGARGPGGGGMGGPGSAYYEHHQQQAMQIPAHYMPPNRALPSRTPPPPGVGRQQLPGPRENRRSNGMRFQQHQLPPTAPYYAPPY